MSGDVTDITCDVLRARPVQIQAVSYPGDFGTGLHVQLFALCDDGSIWVQRQINGGSNVPTDGRWRLVQPPAGWQYSVQVGGGE